MIRMQLSMMTNTWQMLFACSQRQFLHGFVDVVRPFLASHFGTEFKNSKTMILCHQLTKQPDLWTHPRVLIYPPGQSFP